MTAQIGQTKAQILKMYEMAEIRLNDPDALVLKFGVEHSSVTYLFGQDKLCDRMYYEIELAEWYQNQVNLLLNYDGKYVGLTIMSLPLLPNKKAIALQYSTSNSDFYYFDCNGLGNQDTDYRAVWIKRH